MSVVDTKDSWPLRPWIVGGTLSGWLGHEFKVGNGLAAMAHRGANAICARVSSSNDNNVFARGCDEFGFVPVGFELTFFSQEESFLVLC